MSLHGRVHLLNPNFGKYTIKDYWFLLIWVMKLRQEHLQTVGLSIIIIGNPNTKMIVLRCTRF